MRQRDHLQSTVQNLLGLLSQRRADEPYDVGTDDIHLTNESRALLSGGFGDNAEPDNAYNGHADGRTQHHTPAPPYLELCTEKSIELLENYRDDARMDELDAVEVGTDFVLTWVPRCHGQFFAC